MRELGNILPNARQLDAADRFAERLERDALAQAARELGHLERRVVDGEVRYYRTPTQWTLAAPMRGGPRRWFEARADGDYRLPA